MRRVNIPEFRKEVVACIEANRDKVTSFEAKDDYSIFTFCGNDYACEVTLSDEWIGYDFEIETSKETVGCGLENDTDNYPVHGEKDEEIALGIYDDLLATVKAILDARVYYSSNEKFSYTAMQHEDGTYAVEYWERKKFSFWHYTSGWQKEYSEEDFKRLELKVLS